MTITIVCVCGQHNAVHDAELETARCEHCGGILLRPTAEAESSLQQTTHRATA
ncbi:MAG: hypothetical protein Kow0062_20830 [Acidobacteriota bacterium]